MSSKAMGLKAKIINYAKRPLYNKFYYKFKKAIEKHSTRDDKVFVTKLNFL